MLDRLKTLYLAVLDRAREMGLSEDIEIHLHPAVANAMELGDELIIDDGVVPVIKAPIIREGVVRLVDNKSDIYLYDPKWITIEDISNEKRD